MASQERDQLDPIRGRKLLVDGGPSYHDITETVCKPIEQPGLTWWLAFLPSLGGLTVFGVSVFWLL